MSAAEPCLELEFESEYETNEMKQIQEELFNLGNQTFYGFLTETHPERYQKLLEKLGSYQQVSEKFLQQTDHIKTCIIKYVENGYKNDDPEQH